MTVTTSANKVIWQGNGATTVFSFSFPIPFGASLVVTFTDASGNQTVLSGTQYSITGIGSSSGGTLAYPLSGSPIASGTSLTLQRLIAYTQPESLANQGGLWPTSIEQGGLDNLAYQIQQLAEQVERAILLNPSDGGPFSALTAATTRANSALMFDGNGNPFAGKFAPGNVTVTSALTPFLASATTAAALALLNYLGTPAGSATRLLNGKLSEILSAKDFGAAGDGVTNDTAALQAWLNAANAGGVLLLPPGNYIVSSTLTCSLNSFMIMGVGNGSVITTTSATADILDLSGQNVIIKGVTFSTTVTPRTAGAYVNFTGFGYFFIEDCTMYSFFNGIIVAGTPTSVKVRYCKLLNGVANTSTGLTIDGGVDIVVDNLWIEGISNVSQMATGILVNAAGDLTLDHVSTTFAGTGLGFNLGTGSVAEAVNVSNSFFDTGNGNGISIQGTGILQLLNMSNVWSATNQGNGMLISMSSPTGSASSINCVNCIFGNNTLNGIDVGGTSTATGNMAFTNCSFGSNQQNGVGFAVAAINIRFIGCQFGPSGPFSGNTLYGLAADATGNNMLVIDGCTFQSNGSGPALLQISGAAGPILCTNNPGFITESTGTGSVAIGATSVTINHGLSVLPAIQDVQITPQSGWGGGSVQWYVSAVTSTNFTVTTTAAPAGNAFAFLWRVASLKSAG